MEKIMIEIPIDWDDLYECDQCENDVNECTSCIGFNGMETLKGDYDSYIKYMVSTGNYIVIVD